MNKTELTDAVAEAADLTKADAARAIDAFISTISDRLAAGEQVGVGVKFIDLKAEDCNLIKTFLSDQFFNRKVGKSYKGKPDRKTGAQSYGAKLDTAYLICLPSC